LPAIMLLSTSCIAAQVDRSSGSGRVNMLPDIMQYRQMKVRCRTDTYVRNSQIHSLGLFATNAYDAQQMVIEYTGQCLPVLCYSVLSCAACG
jgi:Holliday junction resolvase